MRKRRSLNSSVMGWKYAQSAGPVLRSDVAARDLAGAKVYVVVAGKLYADPEVIRPRSLDQAEACYRSALERDPQDIDTRAHLGQCLLRLKRPAEAAKHFAEALKRTPGRPMAVYGIARAAEALGDKSTAVARYTQFLELWKDADHDRPELAIARRFITAGGRS